ncbi:MAG: c-type cytochrome domain-containing protein, partial [Planctomycetota bacterium]|nr:c-type cytochrome domain-containing protein [Planctomycetota bacterium]
MKKFTLFLSIVSFSCLLRAADEVDYNRDVRPILAEKCYPCHGPDKKARKAKLRLDDLAAAMKSGAIIPGKPDDSELVERIFSDDPDERMPPKKSKTTLNTREKELLREWVAAGARTSRHWAFVPPQQAPPPAIRNASWPRNPMDHFILARLEKEKLEPAEEADRYTLVRRLYLDLIGLPPTPEE